MLESKFRGFSRDTGEWHFGHGWFKIDYTEDYKKEKGIDDRAYLYTESGPVECELASIGEFTSLKDVKGNEIFSGQVLKVPCDINNEYHGSYTLSEVIKLKGQWVLSYLRSEKGDILPKGYNKGFLLDLYDYSPKSFLWSEDHMPHTQMEIIGDVFTP